MTIYTKSLIKKKKCFTDYCEVHFYSVPLFQDQHFWIKGNITIMFNFEFKKKKKKKMTTYPIS